VRRLLLVSLLAAALAGCQNSDDLEPAFVPKSHAFEGQVDPKFAGTWVSTDGVSTLDLGKDGTLKIQTLTPSPSGQSKSKVDGKWLASNGSLLMQYGKAGTPDETVLKYSANLSGREMKLKQDGGRTETTYRRK
jgi:hypothetical protein